MSDALARKAIEAAFNRWGKDAIYTSAGGAPRVVRVMFKAPDDLYLPGGIPVRAENNTIEMMAWLVPELKTGDALAIEGGATFRIGTPSHPDDRRLKWQAELTRG